MKWFVLVVGCLFVAASIFIVVNDPAELPMAAATGSFFGLCAAMAVIEIRRDGRIRRTLANPAEVGVRGGVEIHGRFGPALAMGAALALVGILGMWAGPGALHLYSWLNAFIALVGVGLTVGVITGYWGSPALRFEPDGLHVSTRGLRFLLPWHALAFHVQEAGNQLMVHVGFGLEAVRLDDPSMQEVLQRRFRGGGRLTLVPWHYGMNGIRFVQAFARYVQDPASREELAPRPALPDNG